MPKFVVAPAAPCLADGPSEGKIAVVTQRASLPTKSGPHQVVNAANGDRTTLPAWTGFQQMISRPFTAATTVSSPSRFPNGSGPPGRF